MKPRTTSLFLIGLLILSGAEFVARGPARALQPGLFNDFMSPYLQSGAWNKGMNPYDPKSLAVLWPPHAARPEFLNREIANGSLIVNRGMPTAYPPACLSLLAPLAILPWPVANTFWAGLNCLALFVSLTAVSLIAGGRWGESPNYIFLALGLAFAPWHTGIAVGNIAIVATGVSILAILAVQTQTEHNVLGGTLLGVATCLKPQIALPFFLFFLLSRQWKTLAAATGLAIAITAMATVRMELANVDWIHSYVEDNRVLLSTGVLSDFTARNPTRYGLLNLQLALYPIVGDTFRTNLLAILIVGLMFTLWLVIYLRAKRNSGSDLASLSALTALSLLPIYHRFYDGAVLLLPLGWSLLDRGMIPRWIRKTVLILLMPFFVPGGSLLEVLQRQGRIPLSIAGRWWWEGLVMPHQVWLLTAICALLIYAMWTNERTHAADVKSN